MGIRRRRLPVTVGLYAALNLVYVGGALALSTSLWRYHPTRGLGVALLYLLWLAAIVIWRRRWAWALMLLWAGSIVVAPIWGEWNGGVPFAVSAISVGLLLSPGMLRWVGATRRSREQPAT